MQESGNKWIIKIDQKTNMREKVSGNKYPVSSIKYDVSVSYKKY